MSKSARSEGEFNWHDAKSGVQKVVEALANNTGTTVSPEVHAKEVVFAWRSPILGRTEHFKKGEELRRLSDLEKKTEELANIWRQLDPELRAFIKHEAEFRGPVKGPNRFTTTPERRLMEFLTFGPDVLSRLVPMARQKVDEGVAIRGQTNFAEVRVVGRCAGVWEERVGERPRSAGHVPFVSFVSEVFAALGVAEAVSVENTIRRWSEIEDRV